MSALRFVGGLVCPHHDTTQVNQRWTPFRHLFQSAAPLPHRSSVLKLHVTTLAPRARLPTTAQHPNAETPWRPDVLTPPHHGMPQSNGTPRAADFKEMLLRRRTEVGLCIENNAALVIDGDKFKVITTDGGKARVLKATVEGGEVVEEKIGGRGSFEPIDWE